MLKLKLQYFGYLMRRADSFENTLMLGMLDGGRRRRRQRRCLDGIINSMNMSLDKLREFFITNSWSLGQGCMPSMLQSMGLQRVRQD